MDDNEAVWVITFTAVVILDVALGLLIGIVFSLYFVLRHSQKPQMSQLGQVPGTGAYKDLTSTKKIQELDGIKIFRFETSIYFANAEHFRDRLYEKTKLIPRKLLKKKRKAMHVTLLRRQQELRQAEEERKRQRALTGLTKYAIEIVTGKHPVDPHEENLKKLAENKLILERFAKAWQPPINILIIDLSVVNYVDTVAVRTLWKIVDEYKQVGIKVFLAGCKPDVRNMLKRAEFNKMVDYNCLYFTVHEAVVMGREIVDAERQKRQQNPDDVKLMKDMSGDAPEGEKPAQSDDEDEDSDTDGDDDDKEEAGDADDENEDSDNTNTKVHNVSRSDDEELWYDTSPDGDHVVLISAQEAADSLQGRKVPSTPDGDHVVLISAQEAADTLQGRKVPSTPAARKDKLRVQWKELDTMRPVQKDEHFDTIPLNDKV